MERAAAPSPFRNDHLPLKALLRKATDAVSQIGPTFIHFGEAPKITVSYQDGRPAEEFTGNSTAERCACLAGFVTEKGNPQNRHGIAEVHVDLPAPILSGGVVLIDKFQQPQV